MKKVTLMIAALALVLGLSQCKKQNEPMLNGEKQHVVINASLGGNGSKIAQYGAGLKWSAGDQIVVKQGETTLGTLDYQDGTAGTFEGDITTTTGNIIFAFGSAINDYTNQQGTLEEVICFTSAETPYKADGDYGDVAMTNLPHAVLKLDLCALVETTTDVTIKAGDETVAVLNDITPEASKAVFVAIPADGSKSAAYTFWCNGKGVVREWTLNSGVFYTKNGTDGPTGESIPLGQFCVTEDKAVVFAPGNLYYDGQFKFEDNQWSFGIGDYNPSDGSYDWDPDHISYFLWGNSEDAVSPKTSVNSESLFCERDFTVANDGHNDWYTLSQKEWEYLLKANDVEECRSNAENLWKEKEIDGVLGLIILPDGAPSWAFDAIESTADLDNFSATFLPTMGIRFPLTPAVPNSNTKITWNQVAACYWTITPTSGAPGNHQYMRYWKDLDGNNPGVYNSDDCNGGAIRLVRSID